MIFYAEILNELNKEELKLVVSFFKLPAISFVVKRHIRLLQDEISALDMNLTDDEIITELRRLRMVQDFWHEFHLSLQQALAETGENSNVVTEHEL